MKLEKELRWIPGLSGQLRLYICRSVFSDPVLALNPPILYAFIMNMAPYLNSFHVSWALAQTYKWLVEEGFDPKMFPCLLPYAQQPTQQYYPYPPPYSYYQQ